MVVRKVTREADDGDVQFDPPDYPGDAVPEPELVDLEPPPKAAPPRAASPPEPKEPPMSVITTQKPTEGIPYDQIRDLQGTHGLVLVRLARKDHRGKYGVMGAAIKMTPEELSDIEGFVQLHAGGGEYEVLVRAAVDLTNVLLRFVFRVEGPPKAYAEIIAQAQNAGAPDAPRPVYPAGFSPPPVGSDEWQTSVATAAGGRMASASFRDPFGRVVEQPPPRFNERPAPGATYASDEIAMQQLRQLEMQNRKLHEDYGRLYQQLETDRRKAEADAASARLRQQDSEHKREIELIKLQLNAVQQRPAERGTDMVGLITALAPIVTGMMQNNASSAAAAAQLQTQGMKTLMDATLASANKPSDLDRLILQLTPLLPVLKEFVVGQRGDSEAQVKLVSAMAESQLNSVSMAAQLLEQFSTDRLPPESPAIGIIKQVIEGGVTTFQAYMAEQARLAGHQVLPTNAAPAGAIDAGEEIEEEEPAKVAPPAPPAPRAAPPKPSPQTKPPTNGTNGAHAHATALGSHPMFALIPASFKTQAWLKLLEAVHATERVPVDTMASVVAFQIQHCLVFDMLPPELAALPQKPTETLMLVFSFLPISQTAPDYVKAVVAKAVDLLASDGHVQRPTVAAAPTAVAPVVPVETARRAGPRRPSPPNRASAAPVIVEEKPEDPPDGDDADEAEGDERDDTPVSA